MVKIRQKSSGCLRTIPTLWRSGDGGQTWVEQPPMCGLGRASVTDVSARPDGSLIATGVRDQQTYRTHLGLWASSDGGHSWTSLIGDSSFLSWGVDASSTGLTVRVLDDRIVATVGYSVDKPVEDFMTKPVATLSP